MNANQAKQIKITGYLYTLGIQPKQIKGNDYWYHSPFRSEQTPSFKVNNQLNLWNDYGLGEGGNILDLVMKLQSLSTISDALTYLSSKTISTIPIKSFSFQQQKVSSGLNITQVKTIENPILINYIKDRGIDLELALNYCCEIHYQVNGKNYFSIGFKNDSGGYEHSNPIPFKGSTHPKDITTFQNQDQNDNSCIVFEGFWDFLSYLKLKNAQWSECDVLVLNSVSNVSKSVDFMKQYQQVYTFLDNDEAGKKATLQIKSVCKNHFDQSIHYRNYKDLNDYLCGKKQVQQKRPKQPNRGMKL